jgi:hypothetical protein
MRHPMAATPLTPAAETSRKQPPFEGESGPGPFQNSGGEKNVLVLDARLFRSSMNDSIGDRCNLLRNV